MLPSIMRTFFGTKKVVEFVPKGVEDIPLAEQQTDYINHIIQQKNNGFQIDLARLDARNRQDRTKASYP